MKKVILVILLLSFVLFLSSCNSEQKSNTIQSTTELPETYADTQQDTTQNKTINAKLLYMGQASIRITTVEGNICIPGSSNEQHIIEDYDVWDFELTDEEMAQMTALKKDERFANY